MSEDDRAVAEDQYRGIFKVEGVSTFAAAAYQQPITSSACESGDSSNISQDRSVIVGPENDLLAIS
jgi:hypothetical protein